MAVWNPWRDEIEAGRRQAQELTDRMTSLAGKMIVLTFVGGAAVGILIGGFIAWLIK